MTLTEGHNKPEQNMLARNFLEITGPDGVMDRLKCDMRLCPDDDWRNRTPQKDFAKTSRNRFGVRIGECLSWWTEDGGISIWMESLDSWGAHGGTVAHGLAAAYPEAMIAAFVTTIDESGKDSPIRVRFEFRNGEWTAFLEATACILSLVLEPNGLTLASGACGSFPDDTVLWENAMYYRWKNKWESRGKLLDVVTGEKVWFASISEVIGSPTYWGNGSYEFFDNDFEQDDDVDEPLP